MSVLDAAKVDTLKKGFQGEIVVPGDANYDEVRTIWNAMIDKRPAVIAQVKSTKDVVSAVQFARDNKLVLAVRGAGHNIAGSGLCNDGLVVDFSLMRGVQVDAGSQRVTVEGGAKLADLDAATAKHGLIVPVGINSTTGVAGLTLGGGFGWLSRKYGLTVDSLESAEIVTAKGEVLQVSAKENPELFWAIKGGGGNFGAVTKFVFKAHKVGPNLLVGLIVYPIAEAKTVLQKYRDFVAKAPDELTVWVVMRQAPPLPFLPESAHGKEVAVVALVYSGDPAEGEKLTAPLHKFGTPLGTHVGAMPFAEWQQAFDPLLTPGARNYWKSHNFNKLEDKLFDTLIEYTGKLPSPHCEIFLGSLGAQVLKFPADSAAYAQRDALFIVNVHGRWETAGEDDKCVKWSRDLFNAMTPMAMGGVYVNFMTADEEDRVRNAYGKSYDRLAKVKKQYDPENLFRTNMNVKPA